MLNRERGIGNLPFIAVLVLFVIALALFFMKQDEADTMKGKKEAAEKDAENLRKVRVRLENAYDAIKEVVGVNDADLDRTGDNVPAPDKIKSVLRAYIAKVSSAVSKASETTLIARNYKVVDGKVTSSTGDKKTVQLYISTMGEDSATFRGVFDPLEAAMKSAAKIARENNEQFESEKAKYDTALKAARTENEAAKAAYTADNTAKQRAEEGLKADLQKARDRNTELTQKLDNDETKHSQDRDTWAKEKRDLERQLSAAKNRYINEKTKRTVAMKEDPRDGGVLRVSDTLGTVWINLGTKNKLSRGTRFTVWRPGKGNVRENIAQVEVINVYKSSAETRIVRQIHRRVRPTKGMNVSNPFYNPTGSLNVYIYGDLKNYPTDIAARRLAASGAKVSRTLDDTVNVIVLGEPPRAGDEEAPEDEAEAAAAEKKASMDRSRRLDAIMRKATAIGAIVVTEDVMASFIDY